MTDAEEAAAADEPTASTSDDAADPTGRSAVARVGTALAAPFVAVGRAIGRGFGWMAARVRGDSLRTSEAATSATDPATKRTKTSGKRDKRKPRNRAAERVAPDGDGIEPLWPRLKRRLTADPGPRPPWYRRAVTFVSAGLVGAAGVALLVAWLLTPPPVELEPWHRLLPRPTPAVAPSPAPTDTEFSAALPTATWDFGLTQAMAMPWEQRVAWPARNADAWLLRYSAGDSEAVVIAMQHFTEEEAVEAWEAWRDLETSVPLGPADDVRPGAGEAFLRVAEEPAEDGSVLDSLLALAAPLEQARAAAEAAVADDAEPDPSPSPDASPVEPPYVPQGVVVWRNGTAVFAIVADADEVVGLYLEYDL